METNQQDIEKLRLGRGTFNFKGKLVTRLLGGWEFQSVRYSTPEEVLKAIKVAEGHLAGSITISNANGSFSAVNDKDGTMYPSDGI